MKKIIFAFLLLSVGISVNAQQQAAAPQQVTTFILVRHAEKATDGTTDPGLTDIGKVRASALIKLLKDTKVDAIYSTNFKRTRETVTPLSLIKNLTILPYEGTKMEEVDAMLKKFPGGTIVICGHSNTTPSIANYLSGKVTYKDFEDTDYDNLLLVDVLVKGKAKVTWLSY
ncbi:MAG TPA: phosphoglycerate mutase family protein [Cyclobacteriaceae bacterium]